MLVRHVFIAFFLVFVTAVNGIPFFGEKNPEISALFLVVERKFGSGQGHRYHDRNPKGRRYNATTPLSFYGNTFVTASMIPVSFRKELLISGV